MEGKNLQLNFDQNLVVQIAEPLFKLSPFPNLAVYELPRILVYYKVCVCVCVLTHVCMSMHMYVYVPSEARW